MTKRPRIDHWELESLVSTPCVGQQCISVVSLIPPLRVSSSLAMTTAYQGYGVESIGLVSTAGVRGLVSNYKPTSFLEIHN